MNPFERAAARYDRWFETSPGREIFAHEVACLEELVGAGRWLEVGVGTGRFAAALGIRAGIDPSREMLRRAVSRGVRGIVGRAEALPLAGRSLDGVLLVVTICFVDDPAAAIRECARVLRPGGALVLGLVPAESAWGRDYARKGREGHPFYAAARFYETTQVLDLARAAGLVLADARSCLFGPPGTSPDTPPGGSAVRPGLHPAAGFVALRFTHAPPT